MTQCNTSIVVLALVLCLAWEAHAQVAPMVPGSQITLRSSTRHVGTVDRERSACRVRAGSGIRAVWLNNGWVVGTSVKISTQQTTDAHEFRSFAVWSLSTVHPEDKRIRHWRIEAQEVVRPDPEASDASGAAGARGAAWLSTCYETATLLGDRTDDKLMIDIGVTFLSRFPALKPGEVVHRLLVRRPAYCEARRDGFPGKLGAFAAIDCTQTTGLRLPKEQRQTMKVEGLAD